MQDCALDHPLETGGGGRVALFLGLQRLVFLVEILAHDVAKVAEIHAACLHDLCRVRIVDQGEQQVLERGVLMATLRCVRERGVQGLF